MPWDSLWAAEMLIAAFAGGAFGAAIGALPAFIFTGFMVIAGEAANLARGAVGEAAGIDPSTLGAIGITGSVAFGPVFSPAISFAGGAAAAAYAAKMGYMDTGFDFHEAKNIAFAQGTKPDVLVVGGLFGIVGYWFTVASSTLAMPYDPIAMGVVLSALVHRLVLGYSLVGDAPNGLLNMRPFESEERRVIGEPATDGGAEAGGGSEADTAAEANDGSKTDGGVVRDRFVVEPWLPHQYRWVNVGLLGVVMGILGGFIAVKTGSPFLGFGISAASLVFLNCGVENVPVTHHMTLPASTAALAALPVGFDPAAQSAVLTAVLAGAVFGGVCALFGELFQRVFYAHGDTHWDPPAAGIVFGTFLVAVAAAMGIFPHTSWVPAL